MSEQYLQQQLAEAIKELDLDLSVDQQSSLLKYLFQMRKWNQTYNLTAIRDINQMLVQHIVDSLAVVKPLQRQLDMTAAVTLVDVGSGAGLPGVVLAISCPAWTIHCIDAVEKKMAFVRQMSGVLKLPTLHAVHGRIEDMQALNADIVISRAFASLSDFTDLAGKHIHTHGRLVAMKGHHPEEEIAALQQSGDWKVESVEKLSVPQLDAQRCLVWLSRQGTT